MDEMDDVLKQHYINKIQQGMQNAQDAQPSPGILDNVKNYVQNGVDNYMADEKRKQDDLAQMYPNGNDALTHVHPEDAAMIQNMAGGMMGGIGNASAAEALQAARVASEANGGLSAGALNRQNVLKALARNDGYAQRLGAEAKGASGLSQEAGATLTGATGGNMTDAIAKAQMAAKIKMRGY